MHYKSGIMMITEDKDKTGCQPQGFHNIEKDTANK